VDLFLKLMGLTKTRMIAKRLCDAGNVLIDEKSLKPSHEILGHETIDILFPQRETRIRVLEIPMGKSVAKSDRPRFFVFLSVKELS
jgi:ribosomal 50S subunit-recycling heat shock protein